MNSIDVECCDPLEASLATETFWDRKAQRNNGSTGDAVGHDDPWRNRCIERAQRPIIRRAIGNSARSLGEKSKRVLDLGCGVGRWISELTTHFPNYLGVDISRPMLRIASERYPEHVFSKQENMVLNIEDGSVDFAVSIAVLHHNSYENQDKLLAELHRVLRPGGELLLFESNGRPTKNNISIFYPRSPEDWVATVEQRGFKLIEKCGTAYYFISAILSRIIGSEKWLKTPLGRGSLWLDSFVTPVISPFLPQRFHERLLMRFTKNDTYQRT